MMGFGLCLVLGLLVYKEDRLEGVFLARGAPKTLPAAAEFRRFPGS
jgi:hypothetical protein